MSSSLVLPISVAAFLLSAATGPPLVVAADGMLCDITRTLMGGSARVECLIPPGSDPHTLALRPSDRRVLSQARVVLINGYNLTPALKRIQTSAPVVPVAERAVPRSRAKDPHVWHAPSQTSAMVNVVAGALNPILNRDGQVAVQRRRKEMETILTRLDRWTNRQIKSVPKAQRVLVTEHRAFSAFADRYGIRQLPIIDAYATGGILRPASLRAITEAVRESGTKAIFAEALPPSKTLRRISRSSGAPIASQPLFADGPAPGKSLIQTATANVCTFVVAQGGQCDRTTAKQLQTLWSAVR